MPQLSLPIFPEGISHINGNVGRKVPTGPAPLQV